MVINMRIIFCRLKRKTVLLQDFWIQGSCFCFVKMRSGFCLSFDLELAGLLMGKLNFQFLICLMHNFKVFMRFCLSLTGFFFAILRLCLPFRNVFEVSILAIQVKSSCSQYFFGYEIFEAKLFKFSDNFLKFKERMCVRQIKSKKFQDLSKLSILSIQKSKLQPIQ